VTPYYADDLVTLYLGDMREVLPALGLEADCVIADPPYGETSLEWDKWQDGWLEAVAPATRSLWCFGSMRMFGGHWGEFTAAGWKFSQDIVWEKHNGSSSAADRFRRVHEAAAHWYQGDWDGIRHQVPTTADAVARTVRRKQRPPHWGDIGAGAYESHDGGPRLTRSVIYARSMHGTAIHATQKPAAILAPLLEYACEPGGMVIDPFAGSGSTLYTARLTGRRAVGIEGDEKHAERAAEWLSRPFQPDLFGGAA
jgi:site-specific DNA-methyltransferase (adenine-specific)